jgi:hypothetical protein
MDIYQTPPAPEASPETDAMRSQIEQTRDGMSQTIDEIQARLAPGYLAGARRR